MNSNLTTPHSFTDKDLLLKKHYYAVICSVFSQLVLLQIYVLVSNVDIFHPVQWILITLRTFTSFSTWLFVISFLMIIFAQSIICAKDYVSKSNYCSTRFQKFISAFSVLNLFLLIFHVLAGLMLIWLFLSLGGGDYQSLIKVTEKKTYVLNEGSFYLILSGFWTGFYYFLKVYLSEKHLAFPVVHQRKWLQLKAQMLPLLKESFVLSAWPTVYYIIIYTIWGDNFENSFKTALGLLSDEKSYGIFVNFYLWCFSAIYYFNMNLRKFFFNVFLTELVEFPLYKMSPDSLNLQESIVSDKPIIQNLACLDLYTLSQWSPQRRQVFFTLSQPGGHPHNWNILVENILKLLKEYSDLLSKSTETMEVSKQPIMSVPLQSPLQSPNKFSNLRNMSLLSDPGFMDIVDVTHSNLPGLHLTETLFTKIKQKFIKIITVTKFILGIDFMFGELQQANIQKCLANGHIIIWTTQGISDLVCAALTEDKYGIVQKDIPGILTTIVQLKQNLDKLNKVSAFTKKVAGYDDFNYKMKGAVATAVKRSLFNICRTYRNYMSDFPLSKDVSTHLFNICKS